jgi:hypothetical protein
MIEKRSFDSLGAFRTDWLNAKHHFSFGEYYDPKRMGWGALRVWNDDEIAPGTGFPPHPHAEMEIITYVREGAISHRDSLGNSGRTIAGDVQVMSAGSGIRHAEYNQEDELTRIFQIWILPDERGGEPRWDTKAFPKGERSGELVVLASGDPADEALFIRADARVLGATVKPGAPVIYEADPSRHLYLVAASGRIRVGDVEADARDGLAITAQERIEIEALDEAEIVLVDAR